MSKRMVWLLGAVFAASIILLSLFLPRAAVSTVSLRLQEQTLDLELADTALKRMKGLSGRASLPSNSGMLFTFDTRAIRSFWMPDMHFPIDIIWIDGDTVVEVATLEAPKGLDIPLHTPTFVADRVIELNAGMAESLGLRVGAHISLP